MTLVAEIPSFYVIHAVKCKGNILFWLGFEGGTLGKKNRCVYC